MKDLDKLVLSAKGKDLEKLQQMDFQTQLDGRTFYDAFVELSKNNNKLPSKIQSYKKQKKI